jgi:hypothetical protein
MRDIFKRRAEWEYQRDKILFYFEIGMICTFIGFGVIILLGSFPLPVQISAIGVLGYIGRAVIAHLVSSAR